MAETFTIDDVVITINGNESAENPITAEEAQHYIDRAHEKFPKGTLRGLTLDVEGDEVGIHYDLAPVKFDRIRRITGEASA